LTVGQLRVIGFLALDWAVFALTSGASRGSQIGVSRQRQEPRLRASLSVFSVVSPAVWCTGDDLHFILALAVIARLDVR
jgi:hypothetical protein